MTPGPEADHGALAQRFLRFAERECAGRSPLYEALARAVAEDAALLALAAGLPGDQPPANLLFGCVHYLLRRAAHGHPLAGFYPSLCPSPCANPEPPGQAFPTFRRFCLEHDDAIRDLGRSRRVATNEVQRSAALTAALLEAARLTGAAGWHLVEIGASAGFNLLWDHIHVSLEAPGGGTVRLGPEDSPLRLRCRLEGAAQPPLATPLPEILSRLGLDLAPLDPSCAEDADWLRALVWPDQAERAARLERALALAARLRPRLQAADGLAFLPGYARGLPPGEALCVFHCFTFNQVPAPAAARFDAALTQLARARPVLRIAMEWGEREAPELRLSIHRDAAAETRLLALCDAHGAWIRWLA